MKKISFIKDVKDGGDVGAAARCFLVEKKRRRGKEPPASPRAARETAERQRRWKISEAKIPQKYNLCRFGNPLSQEWRTTNDVPE